MTFVRRSLTLAIVGSFAAGALSGGASAADKPEMRKPLESHKAVNVARGLIVKTTAAKPSAAVLKAADEALDANAKIAGSEPISGKISTIDFSKLRLVKGRQRGCCRARRSDQTSYGPHRTRCVARLATRRSTRTTLTTRSRTTCGAGRTRHLWAATASRRLTCGAPQRASRVSLSPYSTPASSTRRLLLRYTQIWLARRSTATTWLAKTRTRTEAKRARTSRPATVMGMTPTRPIRVTGRLVGNVVSTSTTTTNPHPIPGEGSSWHGTSIAGIIAAKSNNASGIAGIAPGVKIQPVRVLGHCGGFDSDIIAGIEWASGGVVPGVPNNATPAKILNLSLAGYEDTEEAYLQTCQAYKEACRPRRSPRRHYRCRGRQRCL